MTELQLANVEEMPTFRGVEYEDHVSSWHEVNSSIEGHYWMLGAIADSLDQKYGDDVTGKFASDVGCSRRWIWELRKTYRAFENCARAQFLGFKHHSIAARSADPQKAIEVAADEELSTRELDQFVKTGELPERSNAEKTEEVPDVETVGPDDIRKVVRLANMQFVVEFGDGSRHTVTRDVVLSAGYKKCSHCGYGVEHRHDKGQGEA